MNEVRSILSENIRRLCKEQGMSHKELATAVGRTNFYDVIACKVTPTVNWLDQVAGFLFVPTHELLREVVS